MIAHTNRPRRNSIDRPYSSLPFPWKVHELLEDAEAEGNTDIVSWMPGFSAFRVHQQKLFVEHIMPRYFKQTKYRSFRRQLNLWGFERLETGPNRGGYWNPNFVHKRPSLCHNMKRTEIKQKVHHQPLPWHKPHQQHQPQETTSLLSTPIKILPEQPDSGFFGMPCDGCRMPAALPGVHQPLDADAGDVTVGDLFDALFDDLFDEETLDAVLPPSLYDDREVYPTATTTTSSCSERLQPGFLQAAEAR